MTSLSSLIFESVWGHRHDSESWSPLAAEPYMVSLSIFVSTSHASWWQVMATFLRRPRCHVAMTRTFLWAGHVTVHLFGSLSVMWPACWQVWCNCWQFKYGLNTSVDSTCIKTQLWDFNKYRHFKCLQRIFPLSYLKSLHCLCSS